MWLPKKSTLRGLPEALFPADLNDAGLSVEVDGVDEESGEPFFDELPAEDLAAQLGSAGGAGWRSFARSGRMSLNGHEISQLTVGIGRRRLGADGWDGLGRGQYGAGGVLQWAAGAFAWLMRLSFQLQAPQYCHAIMLTTRLPHAKVAQLKAHSSAAATQLHSRKATAQIAWRAGLACRV